MVSIGSSPITGEWKPLKNSVSCGDLITFTKNNTFQLIVGDKILIEGTYKKIKKNKYLLNFLNGDQVGAKIIYDKKILLKLSNGEKEICQSYKST